MKSASKYLVILTAIFVVSNTMLGQISSGTLNCIPKYTSSVGIGNSSIYDVSGYVGIGLTPVSGSWGKLEVNGNIQVDGNVRLQATGTQGTFRIQPVGSNFTDRILDFYESADINNSAYALFGIANSTWGAPFPCVAFVSAANGSATTKDMMFWATKTTEPNMTIKASNGFVGIGTRQPANMLHINGVNGSATGGPMMRFTTSTDAYTLFQIVPYTHDNTWLAFDAQYDGTWRSGYAGSNAAIVKNAGKLYFKYNSSVGLNSAITWNDGLIMDLTNGHVGIGTTTTGNCKLAVEGMIGAREVQVVASGWPDFVFDESYKLAALDEVEHSIKTNKHLPGIPSKEEVVKDGLKLGDMQTKLLQKVEELTLYVIELKKENDSLKERVTEVEAKSNVK